MKIKLVFTGIGFAMLWASAGTVSKFGLRVAQPLVFYNFRLILAGVLLIFLDAILNRKLSIPSKKELPKVLLFSTLNTGIYLTLFILAMQTVAAGIASLSTAMGPLFVSIIAAIWLRRKIKTSEIIALVLGLTGVAMAIFPLLKTSHVDGKGMFMVLIAIISVSMASVYYSTIKTNLSKVAFNGWQVFFGGLMMLFLTLPTYDASLNNYNPSFWLSVLWMAIPVSMVSMILWFKLLEVDPVRASLWLFPCPIFGFTYAKFLLNEPVTIFTVAGTCLVVAGLYIGLSNKINQKKSVE
jgi:probable blue pigment (indigoidine) exporter